ncbi:MAG: hypothetical protein ACKO5J_00940 [Rubrivivax sp.]
MNQPVARAGDLPPGHGGLDRRQMRAQALDGLADDLELPDHGALGLSVVHEPSATCFGELLDGRNRLQDLPQVQLVSVIERVFA